jgi:hypothetical protein
MLTAPALLSIPFLTQHALILFVLMAPSVTPSIATAHNHWPKFQSLLSLSNQLSQSSKLSQSSQSSQSNQSNQSSSLSLSQL